MEHLTEQEMHQTLALFPESYEESRERFRHGLARFRQLWPQARLLWHRLEGTEDLTIDWIEADALERKEKLLVLTSGQHGVEALVGSAVLELFAEEFLPRLEPRRTGLLVVHTINPWGMKHGRRTNAANVDLNRNFLPDPASFDEAFNPDYARFSAFLNPTGPIPSLGWTCLSFSLASARRALWPGAGRLRQATLLGQYRHPKGLYYGGTGLQEETRVLMDLFRGRIREYEQVLHIDMHAGWGPRDQMTVVTSRLEPRDSSELQRDFSYPRVVRSDPTEFYAIRGDMIDYVYALAREESPGKHLFAASFEFGTLGQSTWAEFRGLRAEVFENRLYWFGADSPAVREWVVQEFRELNAPQEARWRAKAVEDARQAFAGILRAEGFLPH